MKRRIFMVGTAAALFALAPDATLAVTRELADLQPTRLTFDQSVLNQLSYATYRDPFDELQTRPYNLLFQNIGRRPTMSPWQGQQGSYTRYFDGLIGNNGTANVDNDADSIQGALIRRETPSIAWGVSAAFLTGDDTSNDTNGTTTFSNGDELSAFDLRGGAAFQLTDRHVLGTGFRLTQATHDVTDDSFQPGTGGSLGAQSFEQLAFSVDAGLRSFLSETSSWEASAVLGFMNSTQEDTSTGLDDVGAVLDRFVVTNYDINDVSIGLWGGYNRLKLEGLGETEYRGGVVFGQRELANTDLSFQETGGVVTPSLTLLGQDTLTTTRLNFSAKSIFQAGETELFTGATLDLVSTSGGTTVDAAGTTVQEDIDDSNTNLGLTVGLRQPMLNDKLRFVIAGRADISSQKRKTAFNVGSGDDNSSRTSAQYAIGLEGALANVTFDIAWLVGEEAPVTPVPLGVPQGSRRTVQLDRLVFSAAVSW